MGTLLIKKYQNNNENMPKCYRKWYERLIHRGTLGTSELAEHITTTHSRANSVSKDFFMCLILSILPAKIV